MLCRGATRTAAAEHAEEATALLSVAKRRLLRLRWAGFLAVHADAAYGFEEGVHIGKFITRVLVLRKLRCKKQAYSCQNIFSRNDGSLQCTFGQPSEGQRHTCRTGLQCNPRSVHVDAS